jgi:hypothetical protein
MRQQLGMFLLFWSLAVPGAGCGGGGDDVPDEAIPDGTYSVTGPVCSANARLPDFPDYDTATLLNGFEDTLITNTIFEDTLTELFADDDCQLTRVRKISVNSRVDEVFLLTVERIHTWAPSDCTFTVTREDDETTEVGDGLSEVFDNVTGESLDLPWVATWVATGSPATYKLKSPTEIVGTVDYGCGATDTVEFTWTEQ